MANKVVIVHKKKSHKGAEEVQSPVPNSEAWVKWETCLRQLFFGGERSGPICLDRDVEVYVGKEAYEFCLHTVCGLKSPMIGETEVWGQFKSLFRDFDFRNHQAGPTLKKFVQNIFSDGKAIRTKYLTGMGSQSYGSLARKILKDEPEINVLGSGLLVKDMLPWLTKEGKKVRLICRNPLRGRLRISELKKPANIEVVALQECLDQQIGAADSPSLLLEGGLVVAAPLSAEQIGGFFKAASFKKVVDLRDDSSKDLIEKNTFAGGFCEVIHLCDFFQEIESTRERLVQKVSQAEQEIQKLSAKRFQEMQVRPYGWEDLCV